MRKSKKTTIIQLTIFVFFLVFMVLPIAGMFLTVGETDVWKLLSSPAFKEGIINSLKVATVSTLIAVAIGMLAARCIERTKIKGKNIFTTLFTLPMLIPSISHGMGLIILLGTNGLITRLFQLDWNIYGFWGIVIGSVLYSFPVAFMMISDIYKYEDYSPYLAADIMGVPKRRQFIDLNLSYMAKPMIAVVFTVFTMIVTDYGVPLMVGGQFMTLPVIMYQEVIGLLDFGKGAVIGLVLIIPALVAFIVDILTKDNNISNIKESFKINTSKIRDSLSYIFCGAVVVVVILPIASYIMLAMINKYPIDFTITTNHIKNTVDMGGLTYLMNSLIIATATSVLGVSISFVVAYITKRMNTRSSKLLHLISIVTMAVPGIVLGLSYVLFFKGTALYGTIIILVFVNMMHFFASPYLMIYNGLGKINDNIENVGQLLGVKRFRLVWDVIIPMSKITLIEMFTYLFVNSMMTISAIAFLANVFTKPLSLMITSFEAQMMLESAGLVSVLILVVNLIVKVIMQTIKNRMQEV